MNLKNGKEIDLPSLDSQYSQSDVSYFDLGQCQTDLSPCHFMTSRVTVTSRCPMDLAYFPMDVQACELRIASWGYTSDDITYQWKYDPTFPIVLATDITLSNFWVMNFTCRSWDRSLSTGQCRAAPGQIITRGLTSTVISSSNEDGFISQLIARRERLKSALYLRLKKRKRLVICVNVVLSKSPAKK